MRESLKAIGCVVALLAILIIGLVLAPATGEAMANGVTLTAADREIPDAAKDDPFTPVIVFADDVSDVMWDDLLSRGYVGDPTDGLEALYPTRLDAVTSCRTDSDCEIASSAPHQESPTGAYPLVVFEDNSARYADGLVWDPDTRSFR